MSLGGTNAPPPAPPERNPAKNYFEGLMAINKKICKKIYKKISCFMVIAHNILYITIYTAIYVSHLPEEKLYFEIIPLNLQNELIPQMLCFCCTISHTNVICAVIREWGLNLHTMRLILDKVRKRYGAANELYGWL